MPAISVNNIAKRFGKVEALKGVSFDVNKGEIFGLIGPDGAGKTTLFRILTTLLLPDGGSATVNDLDIVSDYRSIRDCVGYMPGHFSLYPDLSIEENINFFASIFGVRREDGYRLIAPVYEQIAPFKNRHAGNLSGGMKQKLALCCALIHKPVVLFLDEPTTGIDVVSRSELWDLLLRLRDEGISILVSTPYMDEADRCDRIALISEGSILDCASPAELKRRHNCPTVEEVFIKLMKGDENFRPHHIRPDVDDKAIAVNNLTKKFGDFTAVNNISFSVDKGEIFGFLGANGAGKTTAMRMLCGLSVPTSGDGTVASFDINTQPEQIKRHIGYMSQHFTLYGDLSVWHNIEFFGGIYGMSPAEIQVRGKELLDDLDFYDRRGEKVSSLPLGWKQKLAFSVALLHRPSIVFLDEPTGGVDPVARRLFWQLIYDTAKKGVTIFVTTHYMDEAEYCDRISIMVDGRIAALDTPAALKARYGAGSIEEVFFKIARSGQADKREEGAAK